MRRRPLYALFAADAVSLVGNEVTRLAVAWFVLVTTGSAALTGLTVFFSFLPIVISAFFGGAVVDRLGFRTASIVADLSSAVAVAAIPAIHLTVGIELWQLIALVFLGSLLDTPGMTARQALFPDLVERAGMGLERGSGIRSAIRGGALLVGGPIGGLLVAELGATTALWLDAATFVVSAVLVAAAVPRPRRQPAVETPRRYLSDLAEGIRFIRRDRLVRAIVATVLVTNFLDAPFVVVMPVFAREAFGSAVDLGLMYGTFGGFALAGALSFSAVGHRLPRRLTFLVSFFVWSSVYLVLATLPSFHVTIAALAVGGFATGPINPLLGTIQFERVPSAVRGRVFGAITSGAWSAIPAGILLGGFVVEAVGVGTTLLGIGVCYVAVTVYGFVNRAFRAMDRAPAASASEGVARS